MADMQTGQTPERDKRQTGDGGDQGGNNGGSPPLSGAYRQPAYLAAQAARARPLSPTMAVSPAVRTALLGLVVALLLACFVGVIGMVGVSGAGNPTGAGVAAQQATGTSTPDGATALWGQAQATSTDASATQPQETPTATPQPTATDTPVPPTATPRPKTPTPAPQPTATPAPRCTGVNGNPWCYDFNPGNLIYNPPTTFCNYFACINNFWNGRGYVMECNDGMYSKSGGISGSCSYHRGNWRPLYSH